MIIKYVLPTLVGLIILYSAIKKVKIYDCFVDGATESIALIKAVFPYVAAVFICIAPDVLRESQRNSSPIRVFRGLPKIIGVL